MGLVVRKRGVILCIIICVLLGSCSRSQCSEEKRDEDDLKVLFCGDVLLDRGLRKPIERQGTENLFAGAKKEMEKADAVIINLECPLSDVSTPVNKQFVFRADESCAKGMRKAGITHAILANNHSIDQGINGLIRTVNSLKAAGIEPIGCADKEEERSHPTIIEKNGIRVAVFASCILEIENWFVPKGETEVLNINEDSLAKIVRKYRTEHPSDYIVCCPHWGIEYSRKANMKQRIGARKMIEAGADAIVGGHPHIVQDINTINGKPVFYSIGNFVFDSKREGGDEFILPLITFGKDSIRWEAKRGRYRCRTRFDIIFSKP